MQKKGQVVIAGNSQATSFQKEQPVVIFDRDDTLLVDQHFMFDPANITWVGGAVEAIGRLKVRGFKVCVATNQSGIARGYYTEEQMHKFHEAMQGQLAEKDAQIDGFYYCPHHPESKIEKYAVHCDCRKPKPGLLHQIDRDFAIDKAQSFLVGDKLRDIEAALSFGVRGYMFTGGSMLTFIDQILDVNSGS